MSKRSLRAKKAINENKVEKKPDLERYLQIIRRTPYPYQMEIILAILDSVLNERGLTFTVMLARQMGKNEVSALVEALLLLSSEVEGTIVKAAPTYKPQIINSYMRLLSLLQGSSPEIQARIWRAHGYIIGLSKLSRAPASQVGPRVIFLSASPDAHIVGATASLLLEVDEAQDVSVEKFNRDLKPMTTTTHCTTVLYGTAWSEDSLLAQVQTTNQELQQRDGIKRNFVYDWRTLAAINPRYGQSVEEEMVRLGADHLTIRTQYRLQTIGGVGLLLSETQRMLLRGQHDWQNSADEDDTGYYVAGIDVGGEASAGQGQTLRKRASTVLTIARVVWNELDLPALRIVHQIQWTGKPYLEQYAQCVELCEQWELRRMVIDKTGLGEGLTSFLLRKLGDEKVVPFHFTRQSKSKLTYQLLEYIDSGRLKMYAEEGAPDDISIEAWKQLKLARYRIPGENLMDMYVAPDEGHDDYLISIALCCEAGYRRPKPNFDSIMIRPRPLYPGEGPY